MYEEQINDFKVKAKINTSDRTKITDDDINVMNQELIDMIPNKKLI